MKIVRDEKGGFIFIKDAEIKEDMYITEDINISTDKSDDITMIEYLNPDWNEFNDRSILQTIELELQKELDYRKEEIQRIEDGIFAVMKEKRNEGIN